MNTPITLFVFGAWLIIIAVYMDSGVPSALVVWAMFCFIGAVLHIMSKYWDND